MRIALAQVNATVGDIEGNLERCLRAADEAAKVPVPQSVPLRDPDQFRLIGKSVPRLDTPAKTDGTAIFGIDVSPPGTLTAVIARPPTFGSRLTAVNDEKAVILTSDAERPTVVMRAEFEALWSGEGTAVDAVIEAKGLKQMNDSGALEKIVDAVIAANPANIEQYRAGKDKAFNALVGQVMKASKGKANPQQVNDLLKARLG